MPQYVCASEQPKGGGFARIGWHAQRLGCRDAFDQRGRHRDKWIVAHRARRHDRARAAFEQVALQRGHQRAVVHAAARAVKRQKRMPSVLFERTFKPARDAPRDRFDGAGEERIMGPAFGARELDERRNPSGTKALAPRALGCRLGGKVAQAHACNARVDEPLELDF